MAKELFEWKVHKTSSLLIGVCSFFMLSFLILPSKEILLKSYDNGEYFYIFGFLLFSFMFFFLFCLSLSFYKNPIIMSLNDKGIFIRGLYLVKWNDLEKLVLSRKNVAIETLNNPKEMYNIPNRLKTLFSVGTAKVKNFYRIGVLHEMFSKNKSASEVVSKIKFYYAEATGKQISITDPAGKKISTKF